MTLNSYFSDNIVSVIYVSVVHYLVVTEIILLGSSHLQDMENRFCSRCLCTSDRISTFHKKAERIN